MKLVDRSNERILARSVIITCRLRYNKIEVVVIKIAEATNSVNNYRGPRTH